ncbi:MAG: hypothetical protein K0Q48_680 [Bacillota bacterium]|jgi:transcriptional regulator with XRE-family HTH domain|nr:hypothetical protein [Bacillota bacterium]MDF3000561.1 hypothetical protein [Bacillota bacterium]
MSIGEKLKELREAKGFNKREAAEKLGMPYTTYNNYETDTRDVGSETLRKIARFYGVTIDFILENDVDGHGYYLDEEAAKIAQEIFDNPDLRILFDTTRKVKPEDLKLIKDMVKRMSGDDD